MTPNTAWRKLALMLLPMLLLASGCASKSPPSLPPVVVAAPEIPPLPPQARQPTPPEICSPTCSAGLMRLRMELLDLLTRHTHEGGRASGSMMD